MLHAFLRYASLTTVLELRSDWRVELELTYYQDSDRSRSSLRSFNALFAIAPCNTATNQIRGICNVFLLALASDLALLRP